MTAIPRRVATAPAWILEIFDPGQVDDVSRLAWGFNNESWKVVLADGRQLAVNRFAAADRASSISTLTGLVGPRLRAVGIATPAWLPLAATPATPVVVTEFVEGTPGGALLEQPGGPAVVGSLLGGTWRRLAAVDPAGLSLPSTWAAPDVLVVASVERLGRTGPQLARPERRQIAAAIDAVGALLSGRRPGFVHGDLVPVNIIVRDGALAALLDFEFARLAEPLADAAWFQWIIAFHHPAEARSAWPAFVASADLDERDPVTHGLIRLLPVVRLLELLDEDRQRGERPEHWIRMLRACLARLT